MEELQVMASQKVEEGSGRRVDIQGPEGQVLYMSSTGTGKSLGYKQKLGRTTLNEFAKSTRNEGK